MDRPKTRGPYAKTTARRAEILRAACEIFVERGYERSTLRDIADRCGMSTVGMLHHFGSKEELLAGVLLERNDQERERGQRLAQAGGDDAQTTGQVLAVALREHQKTPELTRLWRELSASASRADHPAHEHFVRRYEETRALIEDGLRDGADERTLPGQLDPRSFATLLLAVLDGLETQWLLDPTLDIIGPLERFLHLLGDR